MSVWDKETAESGSTADRFVEQYDLDHAKSSASCMSTIDLRTVSSKSFDVIVVGAGPAGSLAARQLALLGREVLLVDRARFPRAKVCGCCLNAAALSALQRVGLGDLPRRLGAKRLERWQLFSPAGPVSRRLPAGMALSRQALDAALVEHAAQAGAHFLDATTAHLMTSRKTSLQSGRESRSSLLARPDPESAFPPATVQLRQHDRTVRIQAPLIIAADGLSGRFLEGHEQFDVRTSRSSRIGVGTVLEAPEAPYDDHVIYMACARGGYVGLVRLEDGRLDIAAALDRNFVKSNGGPGDAAVAILRRSGATIPRPIDAAQWRGTPALTRKRRRVAHQGVLVAGDAAGYVEPFTGEGIAWALHSGMAIAPLINDAWPGNVADLARLWTRQHHRIVGRRQRNCRLVSALLKRPTVTLAAGALLRAAPWLATPIIHSINRPTVHNRMSATSES